MYDKTVLQILPDIPRSEETKESLEKSPQFDFRKRVIRPPTPGEAEKEPMTWKCLFRPVATSNYVSVP